MFRHSSRVLVALLALTAASAASSEDAAPVRPSGVPTAISSSAVKEGPTGQPTAAELTARGWTCFIPPPFPTRTVCSHPNQGFPAIPPPADRPATYNLWIFENGQFAGTNHLIRPDLYCGADVTDAAGTCTRKGATCRSTGDSYFFATIIGYYECLHTTGG